MSVELDELLAFRSDHLAWPLIPGAVEILGEEKALTYLKERKQQIEDSERDPLSYGYTPQIWKTVNWHIEDIRSKYPSGVIKLVVIGGNRSSKTRFASNYVLRQIIKKDASRWWCCDSTEAQSRANQMRLLMEQFPSAWRGVERDAVTDIRYTLSDGFPKNIFITPNKSEVSFKFYSMDIGNLPGPELDGIWADELIPLEWVKTLNFRLVNRNGLFLITFTPELGWNETYGYFFEGAQVLEEVEAELCPRYDENGLMLGYRKVPRVMQCQDPLARIIFFHTADNPFSNYEGLKQELKDKSLDGNDGILIRAYGVCSRGTSAAFRMFNSKAHVITGAQFAELSKSKGGVRWHLVDPCDGRNWFMIWVYCPEVDKWIIYREWPSYGHPGAYIEGIGMPGPWTVTGEALDGVRGPGQASLGFSLERYKEEIEHKEKGEEIFARYIDSRYATSPRTVQAAVTSLHEQLAEVGIDFHTMVPGKGRIIGGENNDGSVDMINSALFYDAEVELGKWSAHYGKLNVPQLQVVDTCPNTIYALEHWTGVDGQRGACKDPIDCIRGMFLSQVNFVEGTQYAWSGGGIPR
jgi:hypothetical protein